MLIREEEGTTTQAINPIENLIKIHSCISSDPVNIFEIESKGRGLL